MIGDKDSCPDTMANLVGIHDKFIVDKDVVYRSWRPELPVFLKRTFFCIPAREVNDLRSKAQPVGAVVRTGIMGISIRNSYKMNEGQRSEESFSNWTYSLHHRGLLRNFSFFYIWVGFPSSPHGVMQASSSGTGTVAIPDVISDMA